MSSTKTAIVALMVLTVTDSAWWPAWLRAIAALIRLVSCLYLAWYVFRGPEPVERKQVRR